VNVVSGKTKKREGGRKTGKGVYVQIPGNAFERAQGNDRKYGLLERAKNPKKKKKGGWVSYKDPTRKYKKKKKKTKA